MPTKFRKDLDVIDIHLAARFKSHLMRGISSGFIVNTSEHKYTYLQQWEERAGEWRPARRVSDSKPAHGIDTKDFRWIIRRIQQEVPIKEGLIVHVLEKMSLFRYPKTTGGWKTATTPAQVLLEHNRLFGEGTIRKRRPDSSAALLEKAEESIAKSLEMGLSREQAIGIQRAYGYGQLLEEVAAERDKKQERYKLIKDALTSRKGFDLV